jgi:hypothetical protein
VGHARARAAKLRLSFQPEDSEVEDHRPGDLQLRRAQENVLLVGRSGAGKSCIAQARGLRACRAGHDVIYASAHEVLTQQRAARGDATHDRTTLRLATPQLLVIDDIGLRPLVGDEPIVLENDVRSLRLCVGRAGDDESARVVVELATGAFGGPAARHEAVFRAEPYAARLPRTSLRTSIVADDTPSKQRTELGHVVPMKARPCDGSARDDAARLQVEPIR